MSFIRSYDPRINPVDKIQSNFLSTCWSYNNIHPCTCNNIDKSLVIHVCTPFYFMCKVKSCLSNVYLYNYKNFAPKEKQTIKEENRATQSVHYIASFSKLLMTFKDTGFCVRLRFKKVSRLGHNRLDFCLKE